MAGDELRLVESAVLAVPGVAALHGGALGEVASYLPGERIAGLRQTAAEFEVHVSLVYGRPIREVAEDVRTAVEPLVGQEVHVVVEDIVESAEGLS